MGRGQPARVRNLTACPFTGAPGPAALQLEAARALSAAPLICLARAATAPASATASGWFGGWADSEASSSSSTGLGPPAARGSLP
eukprot:1187806-Rhodomonas_salina.1